jgi:hypothetical protein
MTTPILIGRYAVIPASKPGERGNHSLKLDLTDSSGLRFELADDIRFAVSRDALQTLLDAYDEMQTRPSDA